MSKQVVFLETFFDLLDLANSDSDHLNESAMAKLNRYNCSNASRLCMEIFSSLIQSGQVV